MAMNQDVIQIEIWNEALTVVKLQQREQKIKSEDCSGGNTERKATFHGAVFHGLGAQNLWKICENSAPFSKENMNICRMFCMQF